MAGNWREK
ncbi:hypothetical protein VCHC02A1_1897, partial [Vibrio cholerae HC-02A1]